VDINKRTYLFHTSISASLLAYMTSCLINLR